MNSLELIGEAFRHMEWADARVWTAVLAADGAAADADILERLRHLHTTQLGFVSSWLGRPFDRDATKGLDLPGLARLCRGVNADAAGYAAQVREADLDAVHVLPWAAFVSKRMGREVAPSTLRETMLQCAMHSHYHRAQVNTRLKQVGGTPPPVDFIAWVWANKPRPDWSAVGPA